MEPICDSEPKGLKEVKEESSLTWNNLEAGLIDEI